jgi:5-methylcytosine-specific restriction endonuclease McrA
MHKKKKENVLVLNKVWLPIHIIDTKKAMCLIYQDSAHSLDRDYIAYDFENWLEFSRLEKTYPVVSTVRYQIAVPEIIVLTKYDKLPRHEVKYSRQTLFEQYFFKCAYCNKEFSRNDLTIDHVIPRSRGGKTDYGNTISSCKACNFKKADRTPEEAGMKLHFKPKKPRWINPLTKAGNAHPYESWKRFWNRSSVNLGD